MFGDAGGSEGMYSIIWKPSLPPSAFPSAPCGARCFSIFGFRELDPLYSRWELRTYRVKRSVGLRDVLMTLEHAA